MVYYIETIIFLFKFVNEFCPFFIHHCASGESSSVPNFLFSSLRYSSKTMGPGNVSNVSDSTIVSVKEL